MTLSSREKILLIGVAAILIGAGLDGATDGFAFLGPAGGFDSAGGLLTAGGQRGFAVAGIAAAGSASSDEYTHLNGFLALYGRPLLVVGAEALDFGGVDTGDSASLDVELANGGGMPLFLSSIGPASGGNSSFRVEWPAAPVVIEPGASQTLRVLYRASAAAVDRDTIHVETNDPFVGVWKLPLLGFGVEPGVPVIAVDADALRFGAVPEDSSAVLSFTVRNTGGQELLVGPITAGGPPYTVEPDSFALSPSGSMAVEVTFAPAGAGIHVDTLLIPSNDPSRTEPYPVLLRGATPADMRLLSPAGGSFLFSAVLNGPAPPDRTIVVRNAGGDTLRWKADVSDIAPWLSASPDSGWTPPGDTARVTVSAAPAGLTTGLYSGVVLVQNRNRPILDLISVTTSFLVQPFTVDVSHDPETASPGTEVTVTAEAGVTVDSGRVYWRFGGEEDFRSSGMNRGLGGKLTAVLSDQIPGIRGIEYWVSVHGAAGEVRVHDPEIGLPARIDVWIEDELAPDLTGGRHQMISVPLFTGSASGWEVFPDDLGEHDPARWRLGRYRTDAGDYAEYPGDLGAPIDAGYGFWLITAEDRKVDVDGFAVYPSEEDSCFSVLLEGGSGGGWNQIGDPFAYAVSLSDCMIRADGDHRYSLTEAAQLGLIEDAFHDWRYDQGGTGGYVEADHLEPWRGYFVNNTSGYDLELLVPARESVPSLSKNYALSSLGEGGWIARFRARAGGRAGQEITLGARSGARPGRDRWDRSTPPRPDDSGPGLFAGGTMRADWRPPSTRVERWTIRVAAGGDEEVLLSAALPVPPPAGCGLVLIDPVAGAALPVEDGTVYRYVSRPGETERILEAVCGPAGALAAEGISPGEPEALFRLAAPRPNPFLRGTALRFSIPRNGNVDMRIYNLSGRLVRTLIDRTEEAGEHVVDWDGKDDRGRRCAPGIYFLRLNHDGERSATARLVLFR
ncbi:MAG: choice-of-anchor D domain-containing protein [Candidatus Eisenbacteria bacterium]|nr:choice-of-anchor D domain-containing protein [Candidatus Eisenbacteria bacterium]